MYNSGQAEHSRVTGCFAASSGQAESFPCQKNNAGQCVQQPRPWGVSVACAEGTGERRRYPPSGVRRSRGWARTRRIAGTATSTKKDRGVRAPSAGLDRNLASHFTNAIAVAYYPIDRRAILPCDESPCFLVAVKFPCHELPLLPHSDLNSVHFRSLSRSLFPFPHYPIRGFPLA